MGGWVLVCECVCWCLRFCVFVCVQQTPMHLLRPGDRGKSVLRVLGGSRGGVGAMGHGDMGA